MVLQRVSALPYAGVFLAEAPGRRLAVDVCAPEDQPPFDRSAMDGFAFAARNGAVRMRIIGEVRAGEQWTRVVGEGECVRIYTGAAVPPGCDCVLPQEHAKTEGDWMIPEALPERSWIRRRGEESRAGEVLLHAGARLGAGDVGVLASLGVACPAVASRARVVHLATGDELVGVSAKPAQGQIRDSNSTLIAAMLRESGAVLVRQARVRDTLPALLEAIQKEKEAEWDLLLVSGGAGHGDFDFGVRALEALGFEIHFRVLNLRPGKPLVFATRGSHAAFVIPGNPVSHFVTFHLVIRMALEVLMRKQGVEDCADPARETVRLPLKAPWDFGVDKRETWCPARVEVCGGRLEVEPLVWKSSGDLRGLIGANALVRVGSGCPPVGEDGRVECLLLGLRPLVS